MARIGLHTIGDAAACDPGILKAHLGEKYGIQVHRYANGIDHEPVAPPDPTRKGYGNSITLPQDVSDFDTACQVLLALSETVGARLREAKVRCNSVTVELKDWKFACQSHQCVLKSPTDSTSVLYDTACQLLKEFWNKTPVRLIGLRTTQIQEETFEQISLFEDEHAKKMRAMEKAVDAIRGRYGIDSVQRAKHPNKHQERNFNIMNPIIHHSYKAMENGRTVEELLRSLGYSKSLINRIKLTDNGLLIHGEKVYTTHHMQPGSNAHVSFYSL